MKNKEMVETHWRLVIYDESLSKCRIFMELDHCITNHDLTIAITRTERRDQKSPNLQTIFSCDINVEDIVQPTSFFRSVARQCVPSM